MTNEYMEKWVKTAKQISVWRGIAWLTLAQCRAARDAWVDNKKK